jgi:GDPmannose 4,6-dehydratase
LDAAYVRPAEVNHLCGNASKARERLGWQPATSFEDMIREMLEHDLQSLGLDPKPLLKPGKVAAH